MFSLCSVESAAKNKDTRRGGGGEGGEAWRRLTPPGLQLSLHSRQTIGKIVTAGSLYK